MQYPACLHTVSAFFLLFRMFEVAVTFLMRQKAVPVLVATQPRILIL